MKSKKVLLAALVFGIIVSSYASLAAAGDDYKFGKMTALAQAYGTDKGMAHGYTEIYEYFFYPIRNDVRKVFEIGIETGASLKMFRVYFPNAVIYGIDIDDKSSMNSDYIKTFVADQADRKRLRAFINTYGPDFDIILDDGGHTMEQQQISFGFLFKNVKPGGYYIIEDLHTSLDKKGIYGVEENGSNTTLEMVNNFVRTKQIKSKYMTDEEAQYLSTNIEYCNLFSRTSNPAIMCIFRKKQ